MRTYFKIFLASTFLLTSWNAQATISSESPLEKSPHIPRYQLQYPRWGVELTGAAKGLGTSPLIPNLGNSKVAAGSVQFEYQPAFFQFLGVFGIGPSLSFYPITPSTGVTQGMGIWSLGGQIRYQARYFREQPLVPIIGYSVESVIYKLASGKTGRFSSTGSVLGAMLLLNFFVPSEAAEFYANWRVLRTYLLAEFRSYSGSDSELALSGRSLFFGLRVEF